MTGPLTIMTWLWRQTPDRHGYFAGLGGADKVNVWAAMLKRNCSLDLDIACVTDVPDGIDSSIRIIPLPELETVPKVKAWSERGGAPQCYRRLHLFHPDAARMFGASRFVSMDLDCVIVGNVDRLFDNDCPFVMFKGTSGKRPYNGSMIQMDAGARSVVWDTFIADPQGVADSARRKFIGSDQAVISDVLGWGEETWGKSDGVESYCGAFLRRHGKGNPRRVTLDESTRIVFCPGPQVKPWHLVEKVPFVAQHWHDGVPRGTFTSARRRLPPPAKRPPFFAFDDRLKVGRRFKAVADRITGRPTRLFIRDYRVPAGARVFVCATSEAEQNDMVERLRQRGALVLPTSQVKSLNFDDPGSFTLAVEQLKGLTGRRDEDQAQQAIAR